MTPKEKAIELVDKHYAAITSFLSDRMKRRNAKKCALICVDECINVAPIDKFEDLNSPDGLSSEDVGLHLFVEYWEQVKQEIEKL